MACWANFFAKALVEGLCWANFFAGQPEKSGVGRIFSRNSGRRRCAGRVLYRVGLSKPLAGRVLYRKRLCMRDKVLPARVVGGGSGTKFSLRAKSGSKSAFWGVPGEFCTGWACQSRLLGEFCTGSGPACGIKFSLLGLLVAKAVKSSPCARKLGRNRRFGACRESFVPVDPVEPGGRESFVPVDSVEPGSRASFVSLRARCGLHRAFLRPSAPRPAAPRPSTRCHALPLHVGPVVMPNRPAGTASRIRPLCVRRPTQTARPRIMRGRAVSQRMYGV